jgi:hypothetical protein
MDSKMDAKIVDNNIKTSIVIISQIFENVDKSLEMKSNTSEVMSRINSE